MFEFRDWTMRSGATYTFVVFPPHTAWPAEPAVYLFAKSNDVTASWDVLYAGRCVSLSDQLAHPEHWEEAAALGADSVCAAFIASEHERETLEADLVAVLKPRLNLRQFL